MVGRKRVCVSVFRLQLAEDTGAGICPELPVDLAMTCARVEWGIGVGVLLLCGETLLPEGSCGGVGELLGSETARLTETVDRCQFSPLWRVLFAVARVFDDINLLHAVVQGVPVGIAGSLAAEDEFGLFTEFAVDAIQGHFKFRTSHRYNYELRIMNEELYVIFVVFHQYS